MYLPQRKEKFSSENSLRAIDMFLKNNKASDLSELPLAPENCIFSPLARLRSGLEQDLDLAKGPNIIEPILMNEDVAVFCAFVGFGSPMWAWVFEQLVAYGIKNFVYIGLYGKVSTKHDNDAVYAVTRAMRDEGVSHHYTENSDPWAYPDKDLTDRLIEKGAKPISIWTTDCMFRQTLAEIDHAKENNIAGFEMECSALFAIAKEKGVKIASLQVISDYYLDGKFTSIYGTDVCAKNLEGATRIALDVLGVEAKTKNGQG
ncbi:MAG: hypothetical protein WCT32_05210 [Patescibacteria group bacterium]|jgi:purine-nucleoside phosphorylase